jgi:hypothetical protein
MGQAQSKDESILHNFYQRNSPQKQQVIPTQKVSDNQQSYQLVPNPYNQNIQRKESIQNNQKKYKGGKINNKISSYTY